VVGYVNARKITGEALPRIVPPAKLREAFGEVKKNAGFDLTSIHYVIVGARFKEDVATFTLPEVVLIAKGDFSAEAILSVMKLAGQGTYREEAYGARTLNLFDFPQKKKAAESTDGQAADQSQDAPKSGQMFEMNFQTPQIAATALDANTLVIGVTPYVKAAIDARDGGRGQLRPEFLDLVTRHPNMLFSLAGEIPESASKYLQMAGAPKNDEIMRLVAAIKRVQADLTMDAADFGIHAAVGTDTAENARALSGLLSLGINVLRGEIEKDIRNDIKARRTKELPGRRAALAAVNTLTNTTAENEIQLSTSVPQATVATLVRTAQSKPRTTTTRRARPRGTRRRR
jgi:hypothetical protein